MNYDPFKEYAIDQLISEGLIKDAWDAVDLFERAMAEYTGSKYAVAIDNCTDALFLCLKYLKCDQKEDIIEIPKTFSGYQNKNTDSSTLQLQLESKSKKS